MKEIWIQKIWKNALFNQEELRTENLEHVKVHFPGLHNYSQGPDFLQARIIINQIQWLGSIEIHQKSSDWYVHEHHLDENYNSVVLHVVWEIDEKVYRPDGTEIPQICLEPYVEAAVLDQIYMLESCMNDFSCQNKQSYVPEFIRQAALQSASLSRLQRKSSQIQQDAIQYGWEQSLHVALAKTFGGNNNGDLFYRIAQKVDYSLIQKMISSNENILAVFMGISYLLDESYEDDYCRELLKDWHFLKQKYQISTIDYAIFNWKCRPAQFPSLRLVQWAAFLKEYSLTLEPIKNPELKIHDYWHVHYRLGKQTSFHQNQPGEQFWDTFRINYLIPAQYVWHLNYAKDDETDFFEKYFQQEKENNRIVRLFETSGFEIRNGMESQGCIELYEKCCLEKKCHQCPIGNHLVVNSLKNEHLLSSKVIFRESD